MVRRISSPFGDQRWRRASLLLGVVAIALLVLNGPSVAATVDRALSDADAVTLDEGVARTVDLVQTTAAAFPDARFTVTADSADPAQASQLHNNYSVSDQSDPVAFSGYNDCDSWRNVIRDGWSAVYSLAASLDGDQAEAMLDAVDDHWHELGFDVQRTVYGDGPSAMTRLTADLGYTRLHADVDPRRGVATITGTTACLAPQ